MRGTKKPPAWQRPGWRSMVVSLTVYLGNYSAPLVGCRVRFSSQGVRSLRPTRESASEGRDTLA